MATNCSAPLPSAAYGQLIDLALREDLGAVDVEADLTAAWTVASDAEARARIIARQAGVVAGIEVARAVFARLDGSIAVCAPRLSMGTRSQQARPSSACRAAPVRSWPGERTALNFLQQLSGVATLTQRYVKALAGTATRITDTLAKPRRAGGTYRSGPCAWAAASIIAWVCTTPC